VISPKRLALISAMATGVQVGAAIFASRLAVADLGPTALAMLRYGIGAVILLPIAAVMGTLRVQRHDLLPIAFLGIGQFGILIALLNFALLHLSAARVALVFATLPILTMLVAASLGRETLSLRKTLGILVTLVGVAAALWDGLVEGGGAMPWLGVGATLASALVGAVCSIFYGPYVRRYSPVKISALAMTFSVVFLLCLTPLDPPPGGLSGAAGAPWGAVLFVGASSGLGYVMWTFALKELPATDVTIFMCLSPVTATALDALILGRPPGPGLLVGLVAVASGLYLALRSTDPLAPAVGSVLTPPKDR
jgi:drug/metabolite transporter (DMT)-like permease